MISEKLQKRIDNLTGGSMRSPAVSPPKDPQSLVQNMPSPAVESTIDMGLAQTMPSVPNTENMSQEDRETLESMLQRAEQVSMAPMSQIAQELAMQGEGDDTQLAHL